LGGIPTRFYVDAYLPEYNAGWYYQNVYADLGKDGAYWAPLFEKAWAKINGNYDHIVGGSVGEAMYAFSGAPFSTMIYSKKGTYSNTYKAFT
jgi:hypothetical protein